MGPNVLCEHSLHDVGRALVTSVRLLYWPKSYFSQTFLLELKKDPDSQHNNFAPAVPSKSRELMGEFCHVVLHHI